MIPRYDTMDAFVEAINALELELAVLFQLAVRNDYMAYARMRYEEAGIPIKAGMWDIDWVRLKDSSSALTPQKLHSTNRDCVTCTGLDWTHLTYHL